MIDISQVWIVASIESQQRVGKIWYRDEHRMSVRRIITDAVREAGMQGNRSLCIFKTNRIITIVTEIQTTWAEWQSRLS